MTFKSFFITISHMEKVINFLKQVKQELKKVTWPSKEEAIKYTTIVIGSSFVIALLLGGFDWIFSQLLMKFILKT